MAVRFVRLLLVASCTCWLALVTFGQAPAGAAVDEPDIDTFATYTYRVDPEGNDVDVTIEYAFTADKPDRTVSSGVYEYYFEGTFLAIPNDVEDLEVTDAAGRAMDYEIDDSLEGFTELEIEFRRNLFYRQTADIVVSFSQPAGDARSDRSSRINAAYAGFAIWLDPRTEGATVNVVTPVGFVDETLAIEGFDLQVSGGENTYVAEGVDPEEFWAVASLRRDQALVSTELDIDGHRVDVLAWPGDVRWSTHVIDTVESGLPALIDEVGLAWPIDGELSIVESYSPYLSGYAGWYDPNSDVIEIGDEIDTHLVFHELAHVWFNDDLFLQRWITEGLADEFAAELVESTGEARPEPQPTSASDLAAEPLNGWGGFDANEERERWSYPASWTVTRAIVAEIGIDGLADAVQAAANDHISYLGDGPAENDRRTKDWRSYLDLVENDPDATEGVVSDLFAEWVLRDREIAVLDERAEARTAYAALEAAGGSWAPPLALRRAMAAWRFDTATDLIGTASTVIDRRDETAELLVPLGAELPPSLEASYEDTEDDLSDTAELMDEAAAAAAALRASHDGVETADGLFDRVGAIGGDHRARLAGGADAFSSGRFDDATEAAASVDASVAGFRRAGIIRVVSVAALIAALLVLSVWTIRGVRRRRKRRHDPAPSVESVSAPGP